MSMSFELVLVAGLATEEPIEGGSIAARYAHGDYAHLPEAKNTKSLSHFLKNIVGRGSVEFYYPRPYGNEPDSLLLGAPVVSVEFRSFQTVASDPCPPEAVERAREAASVVLAKLGIHDAPRLYLARLVHP